MTSEATVVPERVQEVADDAVCFRVSATVVLSWAEQSQPVGDVIAKVIMTVCAVHVATNVPAV